MRGDVAMTKDVSTANCPYSGNATVIYQIDNNGTLWGKCTLASSVRNQDPGDVKSKWADNQRRNAGCPKPIYYTGGLFGGSTYKNYPYVSGMWIKE